MSSKNDKLNVVGGDTVESTSSTRLNIKSFFVKSVSPSAGRRSSSVTSRNSSATPEDMHFPNLTVDTKQPAGNSPNDITKRKSMNDSQPPLPQKANPAMKKSATALPLSNYYQLPNEQSNNSPRKSVTSPTIKNNSQTSLKSLGIERAGSEKGGVGSPISAFSIEEEDVACAIVIDSVKEISKATYTTTEPSAVLKKGDVTDLEVYGDDGSCIRLQKVSSLTTVNEIRISCLKKLNVIELFETHRVFNMEEIAPGVFSEIRMKGNHLIEFYKKDSKSQPLKMRLRKKSEIQWNVAIRIANSLTTRSMLVDSTTTIANVLELFWKIEAIEEREKDNWGIWQEVCSGPNKSAFLALNETPFRPGDSSVNFSMRQFGSNGKHHTSSKIPAIVGVNQGVELAKISAMLGVNQGAELTMIVTKEKLAGEEAKRKNEVQKSAKLTKLFGKQDDTEGDKDISKQRRGGSLAQKIKSFDAFDRFIEKKGIISIALNKQKIGYLSHHDLRDSSRNSIRKSKSYNELSQKGNKREITRGVTINEGLSKNIEPPKPKTKLKSDTLIPESSDSKAKTNKLAEFFGVKNQKRDEIEIIVKATSAALNDKVVMQEGGTTFTVRIYFVNLTFTSLQLSLTSTIHMAIRDLLTRLSINDDVLNYVLCEGYLSKAGGTADTGTLSDVKEVPLDAILYEQISKWEKDEIIIFKKKPGQNSLRSKQRRRFSALEVGDDDDEDSDKKANPDKRVSKLVGFFGVQNAQNSSAKKKTEMEELHDMLADKMISSKEKSRMKIQVDNIYKQGSILREEKKAWIPCYGYVENNALKIRQTIHDKKMAVTSKKSHGTSLQDNLNEQTQTFKVNLDQAHIEALQFSDYKKFTFKISDQFGDGCLFALESAKEVDEWVAALMNAKKMKSKEHMLNRQSKQPEKEQNPTSLAEFDVHKVIGRGKFAKVLMCTHKATSKVYAIKVLTKSKDDDLSSQTESQILRSIVHPFIVGLHFAFESVERLYLVMDYVNGGELYFHVCNFGRFSEDRVRFYASEIFLGVECLHGKGIVYRDLKLENILLARDGHVKITDFGLSKQEVAGAPKDDASSTVSLVGTLEYLSPEVLDGIEYSYPADWWAFGVVCFEMLCGYHPFYSEDRDVIRDQILYAIIEYPDYLKEETVDFVSKLLNRTPNSRLGCGNSGPMEIRRHSYFSLDFAKLFNKEIEPPFRPELANDMDVRFFDDAFTQETTNLTPIGSEEELYSK